MTIARHIYNLQERLTSELLYDLYWKQEMSQAAIAKFLDISQTSVGRYLRQYDMSDPYRKADQTGEKNNNFKDGMSRSTINRITKRVCEENEIPLDQCQICLTVYAGNLDRHHKDRNRNNNEITNIVVICPACHATEHVSERERDVLGRFK